MLKQLIVAVIFTAGGVYLQQNYNMPDIGVLVTTMYKVLEEWEKSNRK